MKKMVIVTGMHRSGTSLCAGIINILGAEVGAVLPPAKGINDKGYFEHKKIMRNNQYLLESINMSWDSVCKMPDDWDKKTLKYRNRAKELVLYLLKDNDFICVKDPRICRLLPMWNDILNDIGISFCIIFCVRHPYDVASSLKKRNNIAQKKSFDIWKTYNEDFLNNCNNIDCMFVDYNNLVEKNCVSVNRIIKHIDYEKIKKYGVVKKYIDSFASDDLRHHKTTKKINNKHIKKLYENLLGLCNP